MKYVQKFVLLLVVLLNGTIAFAQGGSGVEMADVMRSNGKIYIVVAVCLTILLGLFLYVFMLDRKISAFEKSAKD